MTLNLVQHRGEPSVWDDACAPAWDIERWLTAATAGACVAAGVRRRSWAGLLLTLGGAGLAWWAAGGTDERQVARGRIQARLPGRRAPADVVTDAAEASFPASDPPAWTTTTGAADAAAAHAKGR